MSQFLHKYVLLLRLQGKFTHVTLYIAYSFIFGTVIGAFFVPKKLIADSRILRILYVQ